MPAGLLPDEGIGDQLYWILSAPISGVTNWQLVLWVNDYVPDNTTTLANLTEATWPGYSRVTLDRSTWTTPTVSSGCATSTYGTTPLVFYVGSVSPGTINYGAAYYDPGAAKLRWVQRFDSADLNPITAGGQFQILPQYTLTSAACSGAMAARVKRRGPAPKVKHG